MHTSSYDILSGDSTSNNKDSDKMSNIAALVVTVPTNMAIESHIFKRLSMWMFLSLA